MNADTLIKTGVVCTGLALWAMGRGCILERNNAITADYLHSKEFQDMGVQVTTHIVRGNFVGATFNFSEPGDYSIRYCSLIKLLPNPHATYQVNIPSTGNGDNFVTNLSMSPMPILDLERVYVTKLGAGSKSAYCELLDGGTELPSSQSSSTAQ